MLNWDGKTISKRMKPRTRVQNERYCLRLSYIHFTVYTSLTTNSPTEWPNMRAIKEMCGHIAASCEHHNFGDRLKCIILEGQKIIIISAYSCALTQFTALN